jgi:hypothetical protein
LFAKSGCLPALSPPAIFDSSPPIGRQYTFSNNLHHIRATEGVCRSSSKKLVTLKFTFVREGKVYQPTTEQWKALCEQAVSEQDGARLLEIINELTRVLDEKTVRTEAKRIQSAQGV